MSRWLCITLSSLLFLIMTAACGKAAPSADSGLAAGASGTPGTPTSIETADVATPTPVVTSTTPVSSSGPIRTADEAAARALAADSVGIYASENVTVKHVEWMTLGDAWAAIGEDPESVPTDSSTVVWWVDLSGTFHIWSCPAPPPGTPNTGCGTLSAAEVILSASDGQVFQEDLGERRFPATPTAISHQIPSDARLRSPGDAIDDGFQSVPGKDGNPPTLESLRLMTYRQWIAEQEANGTPQVIRFEANTPIWQVEFSDADFAPPCSIPGGCHIEHVFVALNTIDGNSLGYWGPGPPSPTYPPGTPIPATPSSSPAVTQTGSPPDALINHNSSGDHVSIVLGDQSTAPDVSCGHGSRRSAGAMGNGRQLRR